jgi:hypothetical protein
MSGFDLAIGIDAATMNQAGAVVYKQLYPRIFSGSEKIDKDGFEFNVSWDAKTAPTFVLQPPPKGLTLLRAHLLGQVEAPGVSATDLVNAYVASLENSVFQMILEDVALTVAGGGESGTDQVKVTIVVQADASGGKMSLRPLKAFGETSNPSDKWFINNVLLPQAMTIGETLLSGITLPPLSFANIQLTPPTLIVSQDHVIAMANLAGKGSPSPPFPTSWPQGAFFAIMSEEAKLAVARAGTASINGKRIDHGTTIGIGIGDVHYNASAIINNLQINPGSPGGTDFAFSASINGNVNAGIKIGCTTFGVNYNLLAEPTPHGTISLSFNGSMVHAMTSQMSTIVLVLIPNGSFLEWLLSAITYPILQSITAIFSPAFTQIFNGIGFDVFQLPTVPFNLDSVHLSVQPTNVHFSSFAGLTTIEGAASISG